ncbi:MAG: hypothetical protein AB7N80_01340 [Bdellovibrionales bacterium]
MVRSFAVLILCLSLAVLMPVAPAYGQPADAQSSSRNFGPRKQIAVIIFAGLAGAILGLSTLSFYGRPQDKLANIPVGAAIGIIIGTTYSTYKTATDGRSYYDNPPPDARSRGLGPESWQLVQREQMAQAAPTLGAGWAWSF